MKDQPTKYQVGPAGFEDAQTIFALIRTFPDRLVPRSLPDILQNIDRFIVCKIENEVCGAVSWQILPEIGTHKQASIEIQSLAVSANHSGRGLGRQLVRKALERIEPLHPRVEALRHGSISYVSCTGRC